MIANNSKILKESVSHPERETEFKIHCKSIEMDQIENELEELQFWLYLKF